MRTFEELLDSDYTKTETISKLNRKLEDLREMGNYLRLAIHAIDRETPKIDVAIDKIEIFLDELNGE